MNNNNNIGNSAANSAKTLAQQIAKQMAAEPLELLKRAREQATGEELGGQENRQNQAQNIDDEKRKAHEQMETKDKFRSSRLIEALNRELADIRKQKLFSELQARIAAGEEIPLHEYPDLTLEQKQVLNAQMEAVRIQRQNASVTQSIPLFGSSKPDRRMGQKNQAKKEQTRVEKPVQSST